jgi:phospholipase C
MLRGVPGLEAVGAKLETTGGDEESPQDMSYGESWAYEIVKAVLDSPAWPRTLLIYTYDEHGGYYDHVPPPAAIAPDSIRLSGVRKERTAGDHLRRVRRTSVGLLGVL